MLSEKERDLYLNPGYWRLAGVRKAGWNGYDDRLAARVGS